MDNLIGNSASLQSAIAVFAADPHRVLTERVQSPVPLNTVPPMIQPHTRIRITQTGLFSFGARKSESRSCVFFAGR